MRRIRTACVIIALTACGVRALAQSPPIDLPIHLPGYSAERSETIRGAVNAGVSLLAEWFPPAPAWGTDVQARFAVALTQARAPWFESERGAEAEHAAIRVAAREMWTRGADPLRDPFRFALAEYTASMAIHRVLPNHVHVERFFGGAVAYPVRQLPLTPRGSEQRPRLLFFGPLQSLTPEIDHWLRSLATVERLIGWPMLQQAMAALRDGEATPDRLQRLLSDRSGRDWRWLFDMLQRDDVDYAIAAFQSEAAPGGPFRTIVRVQQLGAGTFSNQSRILPVVVRFENGDEIRDMIDGSAPDRELQFDSPARARLASVDPDAWLIVDRNRSNNTRTLDAPGNEAGVRLTFNWMAWLQDAMLACTAVL